MRRHHKRNHLQRAWSWLRARFTMGRRAILRPGDLPLYLPGYGTPDLTTNNLDIKRPDWNDPADVERWICDMNAVLDRCVAVCDDVLAGRRSWRL